MLNIGKMAVDQGRYYTNSVAKGREDYYLHEGEAPGSWAGGGCGNAGIEAGSRVHAEPFMAMLAGTDPRTGEQLGQRTPKVAGLDMTFRAPKSVSLLYALGSTYGHNEVSEQVRDAHDRAVREALRYMETTASHGRRGKGGAERIETTGFIHALFRHRTSRAKDPQLHTHAVTMNKVLGLDGKWSGVDSKCVYRQAKTAGTVYQAALRYELREFGFAWELSDNGTAEIVGVDRSVRRAFSQRRQEIEAALAGRGLNAGNAKAAQKATLNTRQGKEYGGDEALLEFEWAARAGELGFTPNVLDRLLEEGRARRAELAPVELEQERQDATLAINAAISALGLTEHSSTFAERDVVRWIAANMPNGVPLDRLLDYTEEALGRGDIVRLPESAGELTRGDVIRPWAGAQRGRIIPAVGAAEGRFSTIDLMSVEERAVALALDGQGRGIGVATPAAVNASLDALKERGIDLSAGTGEQAVMVRELCLSGDFVSVVNAAAGCGKTTAMGAAARAWEATDHRVIGATLAAKAAGVLRADAGIPSFTVKQVLNEINDPRFTGFAPRTVMVVDEASMVGSRPMATILQAMAESGGKVVLVGDTRQLPEVDAGGLFRGLVDRVDRSLGLNENRRQLEPAEQERLLQLARGEVDVAMRSYDAEGKIVRGDTSDETRNLLAVDWSRPWLAKEGTGYELAHERAKVVMLGLTNEDVRDLNNRARVLLHEAGVLSGPELVVGVEHERGFQVGDYVVTREINRRRDFYVTNGDRWIVTGLDLEARTLDLHLIPEGDEPARDVTIPSWYLDDGHVHHAYAITVNISQGTTLDFAGCLGSELAYREALYVAASRPHDGGLMFYLPREPAWEDECEHEHGPTATVDRRQVPLDLGDLGVVLYEDPIEAFIDAGTKSRAEDMAIDTTNMPEPVYREPDGRVAVDRSASIPVRGDGHTAGDTLDLGM